MTDTLMVAADGRTARNQEPMVTWFGAWGAVVASVTKPALYGVLLAGPGVPVLPWGDLMSMLGLGVMVLVFALTSPMMADVYGRPVPVAASNFAFGMVCGMAAVWVAKGSATCALLVGLVVLGVVREATSRSRMAVRMGAVAAGCALLYLLGRYAPIGVTFVTARPQTTANAVNDMLRVVFLLQVLFVLKAVQGDVVRHKERAEQLEAERDEALRLAVEAERAGIARELHDVVAHHVSLMVVQAEAAVSVLPTDPDRAASAVGHLATVGRQAMAELRRLLGVLRPATGDIDPTAPQPSLDQLRVLVERVREAGLRVDLDVDVDGPPLPAGLEVSVYRVVQEALTNTLKHAGATDARVTVRRGRNAVEVLVADDGPPAGRRRPVGGDEGIGVGEVGEFGGGQGLVGMRERTNLFGGILDAGPEGQGFAVRATFPLVAEPA